jgi:lipid-A-disaccharide synthase
MPWIAGLDTQPLARRLGLSPDTVLLVVLPGSRSSEVSRLMRPFGEALARLAQWGLKPKVAIPVVESVRHLVERHLQEWSLRPVLLEGEEDKFRAFRLAHAALAASGTVTLELAVSGTPMVVAYKVDPIMMPVLRRMIKAPSAVLANLILGENVFPEFLQERCTPSDLASALAPLLSTTPARTQQLAALAQIPARLALSAGTPSETAAAIVLDYAESGRGWPRSGSPGA